MAVVAVSRYVEEQAALAGVVVLVVDMRDVVGLLVVVVVAT